MHDATGSAVVFTLSTGVIGVAAMQAANEGAEWGTPMLVLGLALMVTLALRRETWRRSFIALGFVFCAVLAGRWVVRIPVIVSGKTAWHGAPGVVLLCFAWGVHVLTRRSGVTRYATVPLAATLCAGAAIFGYLCLTPLYSLEFDVLRSVVLNAVLVALSWGLITELEPRRGLALTVCIGLLVCAGRALL